MYKLEISKKYIWLARLIEIRGSVDYYVGSVVSENYLELQSKMQDAGFIDKLNKIN